VLRAVVLPAGSAGSGPVSPPGAPPVTPLLPQRGHVDQPPRLEHPKAARSSRLREWVPSAVVASPAGRTLRGERRPSPNFGHLQRPLCDSRRPALPLIRLYAVGEREDRAKLLAELARG
jgi:hypothetical protein